jgi:hypothetical protein
MKRLFLITLFAAGCFHHGDWPDSGMMSMAEKRQAPWPTVRIDEPAGATVMMDPGVFGVGIHAKTPLEGQFQPTATTPRAGYPLEFLLDAGAGHRYGANQPLRIYGRLNINRSMRRHGILVIAPSECALRALVAGDLDELVVRAEVLPTADQACHMHDKAATGPGCPMHDHPMASAAGCGACGEQEARCGGHAHHSPWKMFGPPPPGAVLTLRMTKF